MGPALEIGGVLITVTVVTVTGSGLANVAFDWPPLFSCMVPSNVPIGEEATAEMVSVRVTVWPFDILENDIGVVATKGAKVGTTRTSALLIFSEAVNATGTVIVCPVATFCVTDGGVQLMVGAAPDVALNKNNDHSRL